MTDPRFPEPSLAKNDSRARMLIFTVSFVVFAAVIVLSRVKLNVDLGFDVHLFATANAVINSLVSILLVVGLLLTKAENFIAHKRVMMTAMILSIFFLLSYIAHHLLAGEARYGDLDHNGILTMDEKLQAGGTRIVYYLLLFTHIPLAAVVLPFILFTAYRALTGDYERHKKLVRITWPLWFYVAVSGVIVWWMIHPFYA